MNLTPPASAARVRTTPRRRSASASAWPRRRRKVPNTFTAVAKDAQNRTSTSTATVNVMMTNNLYRYDLNGNLLYDGARTFVYDDENQLISVLQTNAWRQDYVYDGKLRRRLRRDYTWVNNGWQQTNEVRYVYDGNLVLQERNFANVAMVTYTRGNDLSGTLQGAGGIGGLLAWTDTSQPIFSKMISVDGSVNGQNLAYPATAFYHADGNGNVTALLGADQALAAKYVYDPFGNMIGMAGRLAEANRYRFSSKEWTGPAGLYYYLYRFYDPNLQRWINQDPIQEWGGWNLYQYVANSPMNWLDMCGLEGIQYPYPEIPQPSDPGTLQPYPVNPRPPSPINPPNPWDPINPPNPWDPINPPPSLPPQSRPPVLPWPPTLPSLPPWLKLPPRVKFPLPEPFPSGSTVTIKPTGPTFRPNGCDIRIVIPINH